MVWVYLLAGLDTDMETNGELRIEDALTMPTLERGTKVPWTPKSMLGFWHEAGLCGKQEMMTEQYLSHCAPGLPGSFQDSGWSSGWHLYSDLSFSQHKTPWKL